MSKIISILISLCIILNACNKKNSDITQTITRTNQSEQSDEEQSDEEQSDEEQSDEQDSKSKKSISNTLNIDIEDKPFKNQNLIISTISNIMQSKRFDYTCLGLVSFAGITCLHNGIKNKDLTMIITGATIEVIATGIGAMYYYEDKIYIPDSFNIQPSYKKYKTVIDWGLSLVLITGAISIIPISGWMIYDSCS